MTKRAIHQSQIEMLTKCAMQYEHRYVNGIRVPPGIAVHSGTGVHVAAAADEKSLDDSVVHVEVMEMYMQSEQVRWGGFIGIRTLCQDETRPRESIKNIPLNPPSKGDLNGSGYRATRRWLWG